MILIDGTVIRVRWAVLIALFVVVTTGACRLQQVSQQRTGQTQAATGRADANHIVPSELWRNGNARDMPETDVEKPTTKPVFHVYAGSYSVGKQADVVVKELKDLGYSAEVVGMGDEVQVRVATTNEFEQAEAVREKLKLADYDRAFVTRELSGAPAEGEPWPAEQHAAQDEDAQATDQQDAPFCDTREPLPLTEEERLKNSTLLPTDTQARDPELWAQQPDDPGCVLMTKEESETLLETNRGKREQLKPELDTLKSEMARMELTVCVGSFGTREQAELAVAQAGRSGIELEVQPGPAGGWLAAAPVSGREEDAERLVKQLSAAGLPNTARLQPSVAMRGRVDEIESALRKLDEQDRIARECIAQYRY